MNNYKIVISSSGKVFEISPDSAAHLTEGGLGGFFSSGFDVALSSYASGNGGYTTKRRFTERELSLSFEIGKKLEDTLRHTLVSMLSPMRDCEIDVTLGQIHRKITAIPCDEPVFSRPTFSDITEVTLYFIAPSVFFSDCDENVARLRESAPLLTFPMNFTSDGGLTAGIYLSNGVRKIFNPGDVECGLVINITAIGGDVVSPEISLGDDFIRCPLTLHDGDCLTVDTRERMKNIYYNGERCFTFDRRSTFFSLPVGESVVSIDADDGANYAEAVVSFTPLYCGV